MVDLFMPGMNGLDTITRIRSESVVPIHRHVRLPPA